LEDKLRAAAFVRAVSGENVDFLASLVPAAGAKIVKIYYGAPLTAAPRTPRPFQHPCRLLALGRLVPKKGFGVLLEACRLLAEQGVDFHLTLAGDGPEGKTLQEMIRRFGLERRVTLPGFVPHNQVPGLLAEADLFLMPSVILPHGDRDGLPNVILEAMGHAVPVIATPVNGIPEAIYPGETGWLVPPGDAVSLAGAVREALAHPEEAQRRALKGRDLVGREFASRKNYGRLKACLEGASRRL
jgi:glycosyltransferase involved in cell wall biosynthesis